MNFEKASYFCNKEIPCGPRGSNIVLKKLFSHFSPFLVNLNISFSTKVDELCTLWQRLLSFVCDNVQELGEYIGLISYWSLLIVLNDDWDSLKTITKVFMLNSIKLCKLQLSKTTPKQEDNIHLLDNLISVYHTPWQIPLLEKIFNDEQVDKEEIMKYFKKEAECVFVRIKILCLSQCEDLALKLVDICLDVATDKQAELLEELHFILLCRLNRTAQIIDEFEEISIQKSISLVQSFIFYANLSNVSYETVSLCVYFDSLLKLSLNVLINKVILQKNVDHFKLVNNLWMDHVLNKTQDWNETKCMLSIADNLLSSLQFYDFCKKMNDLFIHRDRIFCIEMFMRALTVNINELENLEEKDDKKKCAQCLSQGFLEFATILKDSPVIVRDCLLTAFSLYPTDDLLKKIEDNSHELQNETESSTDWSQSDSLWTDGDKIGLSQQACDDLIILLQAHRHSSLSWNSQELLNNCKAHMLRYENLFQETDLNYLNIDYSQFDNIPRPEAGVYEGIEKGYEDFVGDFAFQNVKDVVKELRFLNKKSHDLVQDDHTTNKTEVLCEDDLLNNQDQVYEEKQVEVIVNKKECKLAIGCTSVSQKDRDVFVQKPLIPRENTPDIIKNTSPKAEVRRKSNRKKNFKENKLQWNIRNSGKPKSQTSLGLKLVLYPTKKKEIDSTIDNYAVPILEDKPTEVSGLNKPILLAHEAEGVADINSADLKHSKPMLETQLIHREYQYSIGENELKREKFVMACDNSTSQTKESVVKMQEKEEFIEIDDSFTSFIQNESMSSHTRSDQNRKHRRKWKKGKKLMVRQNQEILKIQEGYYDEFISIENDNNVQNTPQELPEEIIGLLNDNPLNHIDLSSYESVSRLISSNKKFKVKQSNVGTNKFDICDGPRYELQHFESPIIHSNNRDLKFVHFLEKGSYFHDHNYFSRESEFSSSNMKHLENAEIMLFNKEYSVQPDPQSSSNSISFIDEDIIVQLKNQGVTIEVNRREEFSNNVKVPPTSNNNSCYDKCDEEFAAKLEKHCLTVEVTRTREPVDLRSLLIFRTVSMA